LSVRTINRAFNATGQTVGETIRIRRLARARNELAERRQPIGTSATKWGFDDSSHFSRSGRDSLSWPQEDGLRWLHLRGGGVSL